MVALENQLILSGSLANFHESHQSQASLFGSILLTDKISECKKQVTWSPRNDSLEEPVDFLRSSWWEFPSYFKEVRSFGSQSLGKGVLVWKAQALQLRKVTFQTRKKCVRDSKYIYIWCKQMQVYGYCLGGRGCKYHDRQTQQISQKILFVGRWVLLLSS